MMELITLYVLRSVVLFLLSPAIPDESKYSLCSFRDTSLKKHIFHLGELIPTAHTPTLTHHLYLLEADE